eukprot:1741390-Amphidinium_carterae.1
MIFHVSADANKKRLRGSKTTKWRQPKGERVCSQLFPQDLLRIATAQCMRLGQTVSKQHEPSLNEFWTYT